MAQLTLPSPINKTFTRGSIWRSQVNEGCLNGGASNFPRLRLTSGFGKWSTSRKLPKLYDLVNTALSCVAQSLFYVVSN